MYEYRHGGNVHAEPGGVNFLDFSASINPLGPPKQVDEAIHKAIVLCHRYPDNRSMELRQSIAGVENVDDDRIFCGGGSSDIIFRLASCAKTHTGLVFRPTFSDYEKALRACRKEVVYRPLEEQRGFVCDENVLRSVGDAGIVFLCNPNNPTGLLTPRPAIEKLLRQCEKRETLVVVDECFMDFCCEAKETTAKPLLAGFRNLVVLKAVTKTFALPGIRLGYAMCSDPMLIDRLYAHGPDWAVSTLAQTAGIAALQNADRFIGETVAYVAEERQFVRRALDDLGYTVFDGRANYLFFKNPYDFDLKTELDARLIRIRSFAADDGLGSEYCRIGLKKRNDNIRLVDAVRKTTHEKGGRP